MVIESRFCFSAVFDYRLYYLFVFFNDTATTEIYTLSLHDALPILEALADGAVLKGLQRDKAYKMAAQAVLGSAKMVRSEEHTSELQSRQYLVCRLLLEKKKNIAKADRRGLIRTALHSYDGTLNSAD